MSFWTSNKGGKPDEARELTIQRIGMHATGRGDDGPPAPPVPPVPPASSSALTSSTSSMSSTATR